MSRRFVRNTSFEGLLEFTNRQILITRVYAHKMWATAFATHSLSASLLFSASSSPLETFSPPALLSISRRSLFFPCCSLPCAAPSASSPSPISCLFYRVQINAQSWIYVTIGVFIPYLYLANFVTSLLSRRIRWRGIRYELISQNETRV